jgi:hypothetical protein
MSEPPDSYFQIKNKPRPMTEVIPTTPAPKNDPESSLAIREKAQSITGDKSKEE